MRGDNQYLVCLSGNVGTTDKARIHSIIRWVGAVIGQFMLTVDKCYHRYVRVKFGSIWNDTNHSTHKDFISPIILCLGRLILPLICSNQQTEKQIIV